MLLDTHALLWLLDDVPALGPRARAAIANAALVHASAASVWEVAIKVARGRLAASPDFLTQVEEASLRWLPVTPRHAWTVQTLEGLAQGDPFDRLLVAQAAEENLTFVSADRAILGASLTPAITVLDARL
ncbi:MAG: type II toxin-antitoxin system VapC family toxin [Lapillicoccus sp.]